MRLKVHKAHAGAPDATITLSKAIRDRISQECGIPLRTGYAAWVEGSSQHCPRNLIVQKMKADDDALRRDAACRIGLRERKRLGVDVGDLVNVQPLQYETWYHGTKAPDAMANIVRGQWIVGGSGSGVWMSDRESMARAYVGTAFITLEVAWGEPLQWPLPQHMQAQFERWCREHRVDSASVTPTGWTVDPNLLRWARLYGHYIVPYGNARIFPGVTGSSFKGNRVRIVRVVDPSGRVLFQRGAEA